MMFNTVAVSIEVLVEEQLQANYVVELKADLRCHQHSSRELLERETIKRYTYAADC